MTMALVASGAGTQTAPVGAGILERLSDFTRGQEVRKAVSPRPLRDAEQRGGECPGLGGNCPATSGTGVDARTITGAVIERPAESGVRRGPTASSVTSRPTRCRYCSRRGPGYGSGCPPTEGPPSGQGPFIHAPDWRSPSPSCSGCADKECPAALCAV